MTVTRRSWAAAWRTARRIGYRGVQMDSTLPPKVQVEVVASIPVDKVIDSAKKALYTGHIGDRQDIRVWRDRVVKMHRRRRLCRHAGRITVFKTLPFTC